MTKTIESTQSTSNCDVKQAPLIADQGFFYQAVKKTIQDLLETEMTAFLNAQAYQRTHTRRGYRSGHRPRSPIPRLGQLPFKIL